MLTLNQPPLTQHISIPKDMAQLSCEAFTAGIVEGVLDGLDVVSPPRTGPSCNLGCTAVESTMLESYAASWDGCVDAMSDER